MDQRKQNLLTLAFRWHQRNSFDESFFVALEAHPWAVKGHHADAEVLAQRGYLDKTVNRSADSPALYRITAKGMLAVTGEPAL